MKSLLICGTYRGRYIETKRGRFYVVQYDIELWGQTEDSPAISLLTWFPFDGDYDLLMDECSRRFCAYYGCSQSNIIHLSSLTKIS